MKQPDILPSNYTERLDEVLNISWRVFKTQFRDGRHEISKEAPFQHHFAKIISDIGSSFCTKRTDAFLVDLETKMEGYKGKVKYLDITCGFTAQEEKCAIELKLKTQTQGAQNHGRIDAFVDIEALEIACKKKYSMGRFYMITNSLSYIKQSTRGVGTVFTTYDGAQTNQNEPYHYPRSEGRKDVIVNLSSSYNFEWEKIQDWYFLEIKVGKN